MPLSSPLGEGNSHVHAPPLAASSRLPAVLGVFAGRHRRFSREQFCSDTSE
jgi:hypothetical protein